MHDDDEFTAYCFALFEIFCERSWCICDKFLVDFRELTRNRYFFDSYFIQFSEKFYDSVRGFIEDDRNRALCEIFYKRLPSFFVRRKPKENKFALFEPCDRNSGSKRTWSRNCFDFCFWRKSTNAI